MLTPMRKKICCLSCFMLFVVVLMFMLSFAVVYAQEVVFPIEVYNLSIAVVGVIAGVLAIALTLVSLRIIRPISEYVERKRERVIDYPTNIWY